MVPNATKINEEVLGRWESKAVLFSYCLFIGLVSIFKIFSSWGMLQGLRADMRGLSIELGCMK